MRAMSCVLRRNPPGSAEWAVAAGTYLDELAWLAIKLVARHEKNTGKLRRKGPMI